MLINYQLLIAAKKSIVLENLFKEICELSEWIISFLEKNHNYFCPQVELLPWDIMV